LDLWDRRVLRERLVNKVVPEQPDQQDQVDLPAMLERMVFLA